MTLSWRQSGSHVAALAIFAVLIMAIVFLVIEPIIDNVIFERSWRATTLAQASELLRLIDQRQHIMEEVQQARSAREANGLLWRNATDVALAATVEGVVRSYIPSGGQALSVSSEAPFTLNGLRHVGISIDIVIDIPGMTSFLDRLETSKPGLFIDRLAIAALPQLDQNQPPHVSLECDIAAFTEAGAPRR